MNTEVSPQQAEANRTITLAIYALYAASLISGVTALIAIILNYVKRDDVVGTMYQSHFTWQIRTFWYSLLWVAVGWATVWIVIGFLVWAAVGVWFIYRIAKGWLRLTEEKPMYSI
ncbi:MAG TPA: hypothetical protein VFP37_07735 [Steroidobacteraceae bacterium]|nr:hypothetical protein [Steroidobacteraceae bacterium]